MRELTPARLWATLRESVGTAVVGAHEPLRLSVMIEAPREEILKVLERHPSVRALFDNGWLHLFAITPGGGAISRYVGGLAWRPIEQDTANMISP